MKAELEIGRLLSVAQVGIMLGCSRRKVYLLRDRGVLEFVKLDHLTRITERSVKQYLNLLVKNHQIMRKSDGAA